VSVQERDAAIHLVDRTCPHCGALREADQRYCLECGRPLPDISGRVPALRRRWIRRFGWYPGDWMWLPLALLVVAAAGAAVAASVSHHRRSERTRVITAIASTPLTSSTAAKATAGTWPAGRSGWTIVLGSFPHGAGEGAADQAAAQAHKGNLPQVGVLDSSDWPSLQPGYFVVFTGVYASESDASNALPQARGAGFGAAYTRLVAG
jgi:hypothetical protein